MRQVFRLLTVIMVLTSCGGIAALGLLRMSRPKAVLTADVVGDLKFSGAYAPLIGSNVTVSQIFERANPAVVRITATHIVRRDDDDVELPEGHPEPERDKRSRGIGTGCIIDESGFIVTNEHVVDQADQIRVRFYDNTEMSARLIGADKMTDIALLKVDSPSRLVVMPLGDSGGIRIGEPVVAIGNPYSYDRTVTTGVVSAKGRKVFNSLYEDYIQTDAAINVGNSGGPLLNKSGELIGINSVVRADANGISFAIPVNQMKQIVAQLRRHGQVVRGFLGVSPDSVTAEIRDALGLNTTSGALITNVTEESAASAAGIEVYDVIIKFNGRDVKDKDTLYRLIAETAPGQEVEIELIRNRVQRRVVAMLSQRDLPRVTDAPPNKNSLKKSSFGRIGFSVQEKSAKPEKILRVSGTGNNISGVSISEIDPLSAAAEAGLKTGFVIVEINRAPVTAVADFDQIMESLKDGDVALMRVAKDRSGNQPLFITAVRLGQQ